MSTETHKCKECGKLPKITIGNIVNRIECCCFIIVAVNAVDEWNGIMERSVPKTVYLAGNKVSALYFEDKDDAEKYSANCGTAVGIDVFTIQIIPSSKSQNSEHTKDNQ